MRAELCLRISSILQSHAHLPSPPRWRSALKFPPIKAKRISARTTSPLPCRLRSTFPYAPCGAKIRRNSASDLRLQHPPRAPSCSPQSTSNPPPPPAAPPRRETPDPPAPYATPPPPPPPNSPRSPHPHAAKESTAQSDRAKPSAHAPSPAPQSPPPCRLHAHRPHLCRNTRLQPGQRSHRRLPLLRAPQPRKLLKQRMNRRAKSPRNQPALMPRDRANSRPPPSRDPERPTHCLAPPTP